MNQISRLIAKLCPLGVGFQLLGNLEDSGVVKLGRGNVISKTDLASSPGDYPVYSSSAAGSGEFGRYGKFMFEDERITWSIDGGGRFFYRSPHNYSVTNVCGWLKVVDSSKISTRFLFHVLTGLWETKVFDYTKKAHPSVIREEYLIPLPPIEIQIEIVRILDAFTELTTELTAELTARKKQYNYYRDQLLSFEDGDVEWKRLGGLVEVNTGSKPSAILENTTSFDYINAGTSRSGYSAASNCEGDTVTTPSRGQGGIGFMGYQRKPFWLGPLCYKLQSTDKAVLINKYLFYFLQSRSELLLGLKKEGGVPAVNKSDLVQLEIPVPSVEEQKRIVAILDKFDTLANSITEGLPREIELRQKQYEYYRDLLLSFPKPEEVAA